MNIAERLQKLKAASGLTIKEISEKSGIPMPTVEKVLGGQTKNPSLNSVQQILYAMGYTLDDLSENKRASTISAEALKIAQKYERLNTTSKGAVSALITYYENSKEVKMKSIPLFGQSMAAGFGEPDFGTDWFDAVDVPETSKADFAVKVHGDSLEPYFHDGDIALGLKGLPQIGQVGAFYLDGEWILKQYCDDSYGNVYLFAVNRECKSTDRTLWHGEEHMLLCMGTLVMDHIPLPND